MAEPTTPVDPAQPPFLYVGAALSSLGYKAAAIVAMETETALVRLFAVTSPEWREAAMAEVERRKAFLRTTAAAIESVTDDMIHGRWA